MAGEISEEELSKNLPMPTTPEKLKLFITPVIIHIQTKEDCKDGTFGIEIECTWDVKKWAWYFN